MKKVFLILLSFGSIIMMASAQNYRFWGTYYGGSSLDFVKSITVDAAGNVYMVGHTMSTSAIATAGSYQPTNAGSSDAFLVKFNAAGVRQWATYYGGPDDDLGYGVKLDAGGNIFLSGYTYSTSGIATAGAYQTSLNGATTRDAFLVKFNSAGVRQWATYYGGENNDQGSRVATDGAGDVYLVGETYSTTGIAQTGDFQDTCGGGAFVNDGFLVKFSSTGSRLWGTYYGGESFDQVNNVVTDNSGNVFICGTTMSTLNMASAGSFKATLTGFPNAFLAKFNSTGSRLWGTYYGAGGPDVPWGIAADGNGNVYIGGTTLSSTDIASGGFQNTFGGNATTDAFLVKFSPTGVRLWGTYYGNTGEDEGTGVAVDANDNVFFSGDSYSMNVGNSIATPNGFQTSLVGGVNAENQFLAVFTPNGNRISATYYGGLHEEDGLVAVTPQGYVYLAGEAVSTTGISSNGHQNSFGGGMADAYLVKFSSAAPRVEVNVPNDTVPPTPTTSPPKKWYTIALFNGGSVSISNAFLRNFSPGQPLPTTGSATISFTCDFTGSYSNSSGTTAVICSATAQIKVTFASVMGANRVYDSEMLQLNLSGGTLPSGVQLRESPTIASTGQLVITDIGGGQFSIGSFFDVFTELSLDGGASWQPSSDPPAHMDLQDDPQVSIPTLSEWGLISFGILVLCFGIYFIRTKAG